MLSVTIPRRERLARGRQPPGTFTENRLANLLLAQALSNTVIAKTQVFGRSRSTCRRRKARSASCTSCRSAGQAFFSPASFAITNSAKSRSLAAGYAAQVGYM
jgi:hypothetical protein